ncbi:hypothetical protein PLESTB_000662100 [Pleodorina starrii]|uniref:Guanylate cyclase domain-containing protein n=1 Tax=Pleodorina starrii TaxID=330485 RepID=A0A9W6BJ20_9CHLO|nr:hypothetical protein PLESTB_000662100 [Pleodorina starrii]
MNKDLGNFLTNIFNHNDNPYYKFESNQPPTASHRSAMADDGPYEPLFAPTDPFFNQNVPFARASDAGLNSARASKAGGPAPSLKEQPLEKQTSLLHQSSGYLKQATSGFMRWQSRRAFWSAVDPAAAPQPPTVTVACANTRSATAYWFKTLWDISRRHRSVILAPLLLACALIAGGLAGVILSAQHTEQRARDNTATVAWQEASTLELLVNARLLQPGAALSGLAREQPQMGLLNQALPSVLPRLLQPQAAAIPVRQIVLAPFGIVNTSYSPPPTASNGQPAPSAAGGSLFSVGGSVWGSGAGGGAASAAALAVQKRLPVVATVTTAATVSTGGLPDVLLVSYHPVFVSGVSAGETWGNAVPSDATLNAICASGNCYDAGSGTKLWGFAVVVASLTAMAATPEAGLLSLAGGGYRYRFAVLPSGGAEWVQVSASQPPPRGRRSMATVPVQLAGPWEGTAAAAAAGTEGQLLVDHDDGWQVNWEGPLIAVVILVSLALSSFLLAVLFNYWRHVGMLQAMLPEKVIRVLDTGSNYYQHFDCVTVLYADVVRYTAAKSQQLQGGDGAGAVPTQEVVKALNDVHAMYESIIRKYGLVRIQRSGESFLCVGGCPTPDEPVAVAMRVASCARELLLATSRFRGSGGFRVQIRMGLHSGPAVAAVVGSKMPRFSLFGDVVDVAYYMEATSRIMAVHVSERTSQLLTSANDPLLQLTPRGRLDIIGQGHMNTSWLRLDQLPDPAAPATADERKNERDTATMPSAAATIVTGPQDLGPVGRSGGGGGRVL